MKWPFKCYYQFVEPVASVPGNQIPTVSLWMHLSPDLGDGGLPYNLSSLMHPVKGIVFQYVQLFPISLEVTASHIIKGAEIRSSCNSSLINCLCHCLLFSWHIFLFFTLAPYILRKIVLWLSYVLQILFQVFFIFLFVGA